MVLRVCLHLQKWNYCVINGSLIGLLGLGICIGLLKLKRLCLTKLTNLCGICLIRSVMLLRGDNYYVCLVKLSCSVCINSTYNLCYLVFNLFFLLQIYILLLMLVFEHLADLC